MKSKSPSVVAMIQARMGSSRLPGKVLADIRGRPMVDWIAERLAAARHVDRVAIVTTEDPSDDALVRFAHERSIAVYRGSVDDLVARFHDAARHFGAEIMVRIWGDCPFIDPAVVDRVLAQALDNDLDYATNSIFARRTYPVGLDLEVYHRRTLSRIRTRTDAAFHREFPFEFIRAHREDFSVGVVRCEEDHSQYHLTVDYPQDLALARTIYERLEGLAEPFDFHHVVDIIEADPALLEPIARLERNIEYQEQRRRQA